MPSDRVQFTTGPSLLPDIGTVSYNSCRFSPLFASQVTGDPVKDEGNRTTKYTKATIEIDGYVTLPSGSTSINQTMHKLHELLTACGGPLIYKGRGFDIIVNTGPVSKRDLAWGPIPELLEFQPLGGGLSAKVKWRVTVHIPGLRIGRGFAATWGRKLGENGLGETETTQFNLLQFNFETSVSYGEDGFSSLSMNGTLEIPMTRIPNQSTRTLTRTADDARPIIDDMCLHAIDLSRFRVTQRDFNTSRDKRTLTWTVKAEEKPYMDLPPFCPIAKGSYTVKPARTGPGLCLWLCTLSATYTLRADVPRRTAYELFLALLRLRMAEESRGNRAGIRESTTQQQNGGNGFDLARTARDVAQFGIRSTLAIATAGGSEAIRAVTEITRNSGRQNNQDQRRCILIDFNFNEGIYLDSKTITFSATWRLCTTFSHILIASGLWTKVNERNNRGGNLWATSMQDVSRSTSWLSNRTDPSYAVIVDFGS